MTEMSPAHVFMRDLARIINPEFWEKTAEAYWAMIPMLGDVPDRCWRSRKCLEAVALAPRKARTPNIGDLRAAIFQWVRDNPDGTPRLTDPTTDGWDTMDHQWWSYWLLRSKNDFDAVRTPGAEFPRTTRAHTLSLIKGQSPKAYARIIGDKDAHENDADRQWWLDRIARFEREYRNPTARWREFVGMREVLTREDAHPRPFVIHRLDLAIQDAEAAGADTNPAGVYRASQNLVESVSRMLRAATTGRAQRPSGGL